jgi:hypothetical protein
VQLFDINHPLSGKLGEGHERIRRAVANESEDYVRGVDAEKWADHLVSKHEVEAPQVTVTEPPLEDLGEAQVDATGMPGVTFSTSEWGQQLIRPGRRVLLTVPVSGPIELVQYWPSSGTAMTEVGSIEKNGTLVRVWGWPLQRGPQELQAEISQVFGAIVNGVDAVAREVAAYNAGLKEFAVRVIAERKAAVDQQQSFLDSMTIPVKRREDAPADFSVPAITPKPSVNKAVVPKPVPLDGPTLGKLYDDILAKARTMGVTMERSPATYAGLDEETLRTQLLTMLNSHWEGQAFAEAFNANGKTDLLIRVQDLNLFIGECKWWSGPKAMGEALDQLLGYSTWRDSRLALIFFVPTKDPVAVTATAKEAMEARPEFVAWEPVPDKELRCRIRWPDDQDRTAVLAILFFHLPRGAR